jgi:hypothetical protein
VIVIRRRRADVVAGVAGPLLLTLVTTCAGHLPPCPAAGGPTWTELESAHFRLRTDEDAAAGRAALTDLEQLQAALLMAVFGVPPDLDTGKLPVVVVDRGWTDFAPRQVDGYFTYALFQPLIVMVAGSQLHRQDLIKHELVHYLSHMVMPHQPRWLAEGLATYYETIEYEADSARLTVGRPSPGRLRDAQHLSVSSIESIFTAPTVDSEDARFYGAAWITLHFLMNHRAVALESYEKALRDGASPEVAWTTAFGAETPAQLAFEVRQYLDGGQYEILVYKFPPPRLTAPIERRLTDADTHSTRALLYLTGARTRSLSPELALGSDDPRPAAKRELDEALRQDPAHVRSRAIFHWMLGGPVDLGQATAASRTSADDWLAWLLLVDARGANHDAAGRSEALARAINIARSDRSIAILGRERRTGH